MRRGVIVLLATAACFVDRTGDDPEVDADRDDSDADTHASSSETFAEDSGDDDDTGGSDAADSDVSGTESTSDDDTTESGDIPSSDTTSADDGCEHVDLVTGTYALCRGGAAWPDARRICAAQGGDLAVVDDVAENAAINDEAATQFAGLLYFWLGGSDLELEGQWVWLDDATPFWEGGPVGAAFTQWGAGEPNDAFGEDCLGLPVGPSLSEWVDLDCANLQPFVCELP